MKSRGPAVGHRMTARRRALLGLLALGLLGINAGDLHLQNITLLNGLEKAGAEVCQYLEAFEINDGFAVLHNFHDPAAELLAGLKVLGEILELGLV